jgi:GTP-binding protein
MNIRNIAIIAHVDHGKTTLVDALLRQSLSDRESEKVTERAMDSNDLEKERGITILAKCTSVFYEDTKINIMDTPGHADFGGEVERILGMVEGVILLVDSKEGAMPQTRFVTAKALSLGLKPIVVINKMDKPDKRPQQVHEEILDLFINLNASNEQLEFPVLYASGRDGWVSTKEEEITQDAKDLFETIMSYVPSPAVIDEPFAMVGTILENDPYVGRIITGKIHSGYVKVGDSLKAFNLKGEVVERAKATKIMVYEGLNKNAVDEAFAGDIIALAGFGKATISDTLCHNDYTHPLDAKPIDPPLLSMMFSVNTSPFAGKEGKKLTSRMIRDRLFKEQEGNVSIKVTETESADSFDVAGRGELQLAIIIETMRREGFELSVERPKVLIKEESGKKMEPVELVQVDVDNDYSGVVMETLQKRKGIIKEMGATQDNKQRIVFAVPTRGLIGYYSKFLTDTRGTGTMSRIFYQYEEWKGLIETRNKGSLISNSQGKAAAYSLLNLEDRGTLFVAPGDEVYIGMIIGEHSKENDLDVNPIKTKQLTNVRAAGKDDNVLLAPPKKMTLEEAISYIEDDEMIEVTPTSIRLRKKYLDPNDRKRFGKK